MGAFWNYCAICGKVIYSGRPLQRVCLSGDCAKQLQEIESNHDDSASHHPDYVQRMLDVLRPVLERLLPNLY